MKKWYNLHFMQTVSRRLIENAVPFQHRLMAEVREIWEKAVGRSIANHTYPATLLNGTLTVYVDDPIWIQELSLRKDEIKDHLFEHIPFKDSESGIKTIRFKFGEIRKNQSVEKTDSRMVIDADTMEKINESVKDIEDNDLRLAMRNYLVQCSKKLITSKPRKEN